MHEKVLNGLEDVQFIGTVNVASLQVSPLSLGFQMLVGFNMFKVQK